jgi:hypothetical protein
MLNISTVSADVFWAIHAGSVLVTPGEKPLNKMTIVVREI